MDSIIEAEHLHRDYITHRGVLQRRRETIHAVRDLSFTVRRGEIFGLLGQNGAGKTTTIKMLTTLLLPTSGTLRVLGYDAFCQEKAIRPRINFIFGGEMGVYLLMIFTGAEFPRTQLPVLGRWFGSLLPLTHAIAAMEQLWQGAYGAFWHLLLLELLVAAAYSLAAWAVFRTVERLARKRGTFDQF